VRFWASSAVLADGKVFIHGGSTVSNQAVGEALTSQLWHPATASWSPGATGAKSRLYHSSMLLLPDGSVLTGGGGAPGPVRQQNAEIYYPPYLFKTDGSGQLAARPAITGSPTAIRLGRPFDITVAGGTTVSRVTLVRTASNTHALTADQRFFTLTHGQSGDAVTIQAPSDINIALPGWYMLFVFNENGTPSLARILRVSA
jgi:hypothetical protein